MRSINKIFIVGNLTRDPHMKTTNDGQKITTFGVATNREWAANGQRNKSTEFHEVAAWGKLAEICTKILSKGSLVYVEAHIKTRKWETDGVARYKTELCVQNVISLDKRQRSSKPSRFTSQSAPIKEEASVESKPSTESAPKTAAKPNTAPTFVPKQTAPQPASTPKPVAEAPKTGILGSIGIDDDLDL